MIILKDLQSISQNIDGLRCNVVDETEYTLDAGRYNVKVLESEDNPQNVLALITKYIGKAAKQEYVCFMPEDYKPGTRDDVDFLFNGDNFAESIVDGQENTFNRVHELNGEFNHQSTEGPCFLAEYKTSAKIDNPFAFAFEQINPETSVSFVELYQGVQVTENEVIEL